MTIDDMPAVYETAGKSPETCWEDAIEQVRPGDGPLWLLREGSPFAVVYPAGGGDAARRYSTLTPR